MVVLARPTPLGPMLNFWPWYITEVGIWPACNEYVRDPISTSDVASDITTPFAVTTEGAGVIVGRGTVLSGTMSCEGLIVKVWPS